MTRGSRHQMTILLGHQYLFQIAGSKNSRSIHTFQVS